MEGWWNVSGMAGEWWEEKSVEWWMDGAGMRVDEGGEDGGERGERREEYPMGGKGRWRVVRWWDGWMGRGAIGGGVEMVGAVSVVARRRDGKPEWVWGGLGNGTICMRGV